MKLTLPRGVPFWKSLGALPVAGGFVLTVWFAVHNSSVAYERPDLLAGLNTVFLGGVPTIVALLAAVSYRTTGSRAFLMMGCGLFSLAISSVLAGWAMPISGGPNATVTLHNLGVLLAGVFHVASAHFLLSELSQKSRPSRSTPSAVGPYIGIAVLFSILALLVLSNKLPVFFDPQTGPSPLRQCVLVGAVCLFTVSGFVFLQVRRTLQTKFAYWYGLALLLITVGLGAVLLQRTVGGGLSWTGRSAQYLGSVYFVIAVMRARREITEAATELSPTMLWPYLEQRIKAETSQLEQANASLRHEITERQRLETALRESEEKYRLLVENQSDLVIQFDSANRIRFASPTYCAMFGKSEAELLGSTFMPLVHEEDRARVQESLQKVLVPPHETQHEERAMTIAGWRCFAWSAKAVLSADGQIASIIGVGRDITERKQAEVRLRAREESFRNQFANNAAVMLLIDPSNGAIIDANAAAVGFYGYPREQLLSMRITEINTFPAAEVRGAIASIRQNQGARFEFQHRLADGSARTVEVSSSPIQTGERLMLHSIIFDITERKQAEAAAAKAREHYQYLVETASDGIYILDVEGNLVEASPSFYRMMGYTPDEKPRLHVADWAMQWSAAELKVRITNLLRQSGIFETRHRRRDGQIIEVEINARGIEIGGRLHLYASSRDITQRKQAEAALLASEARLKAILENSRDAIGVHLEGTWVLCNPAALRLFGLTAASDLLGTAILNVIAPGERERIRNFVRSRTEEAAAPSAYVTRGLRADGTEFDMEVALSKFPLEGKIHVFVILRDITERLRTEEKVRQLAREQQIILENANIGISLIRDRKQVWINDKTVEMFRYPREELEGHTTRKLYPSQEAYDQLSREAYPALAKGSGYETVQRLVRGDGVLIWVRYIGKTIDPADMSKGVLWLLEDITERKLQEEESKENHRRLTLALDQAHLAYLEMDAATSTFAFNDRFYALYGTTAEREGGYRMKAEVYAREFMSADVQHVFPDDIAKLMSGEIAELQQEHHIRRRDGELRDIVVRITVVRDADGKVVGTRGSIQDITETKRTAERLREYEQRFRVFFEDSPDAYLIMEIHDHGRISACNVTAAAMLRGTKAQIIGKTPDEISPQYQPNGELSSEAVADRVRYSIAHGKHNFEWMHRRMDGEDFWAHVTDSVITIEGRQVLLVAWRDVTETKRAAEALRQSTEWFRTVVSSMAEGIVLQLTDATIIDCNAQAEKILSLTRDQILGRTSLDPRWNAVKEDLSPFPGEEHPAVVSLRTGQSCSNVVMGLNLPDGSFRWININAEPIIRPEDDKARAVVCSFSDITERIKQQEKLKELFELTTQDARTKSELLREVNHRVTNNLTSVLGLMVYEKNGLSGEARARIEPTLDRLQQRIRGLLTVHRMLSLSTWAPVNVTQLAGEIIRAALNAAPWRNQAVVDIEPSALRVSPRQANGVALIFNELATNTVKYAHLVSRPVRIRVELVAAQGFVTICYRDNGPGFPPDVLENRRSNIGLKLIRDMVATTLAGTLELENDDGAKTTIRLQPEKETRT